MDRRGTAAVVVVALLVGAPFLNKAVHIDDTFVLTVSRQILREPLRPFHGDINWGRGLTPIFERTKNPPLLSYYLAPLIAAFGYSEPVLHGAMLAFLLMLAAGAWMLGRWFGVGGWWPMLFVMFSPAVVVSPNLMRDVPAAGLATLGLALFVVGTDDDRRGLLAWGSALVGLATLTKYSAAALVPLLVLYPVLRRKWRHALWAAVPAALLGLWCVQNWLSQGVPHVVRLMQQRAARQQGFGRAWQEKLLAGLTIAGSILFLLPAVAVAWARRRAWLALPGVVAVAAAAGCGVNLYFGDGGALARPDLVVRHNGLATAGTLVADTDEELRLRIRDTRVIRIPRARVAEVSADRRRVVRVGGATFAGKIVIDTPDLVGVQMSGRRTIRVPRRDVATVGVLSWQYYLWAATGAALLAVALGGGLGATLWAWRRRSASGPQWLFLAAWAGAVVGFSVVLAPFQATRHFLPALAPLVRLVLRLLGPRRKAVAVALGVVLAVQAAVAYVVGFADGEFSGAHRRFARDSAQRYVSAGQEVWFNGHWGWQHYAAQVHGFRHAWHHGGRGGVPASGALPPAGAILLEPAKVQRSRYPRAFRRRLVPDAAGTQAFAPAMPARTMDGAYSSFYAVTEHRLPYYLTFEKTPVDVGRAFRVAEKVSGAFSRDRQSSSGGGVHRGEKVPDTFSRGVRR